MLTTVVRAQYHQAFSGVSTQLVTNLLTAASAAIEAYIGSPIEQATYSASNKDLYFGNDLGFLILRHVPVTTFTSVVITDFDGTDETITSAVGDFKIDTGGSDTQGILAFGPNNASGFALFPCADFRNIQVNYVAGYATIPDAIQEACIQVAANMYGATASVNPGLTEYRMGEYMERRNLSSTGKPAVVDDMVKAMIDKYRRIVAA